MAVRSRFGSAGRLLVPLLLLIPTAACGSQVEAADLESQASLLPADPLAEVPIDSRWSALSAYNSRRESVGDWEGKREGFRTLWHQNGVKKGEGEFRDDLKHGPWTWWYESGQKRWEGSYAADRPDGFERAWYENGQLEYEGGFKDDKREGPFRRWYDSGQKELEGTYVAGRREGQFRYWSYDGALDRERSGLYENDARVADLPE